MPLPKRRHSSTRRDKRRANWKLEVPMTVKCPSCSKPRMPHTVCPSCGHYNGKTAWTIKKKVAKA